VITNRREQVPLRTKDYYQATHLVMNNDKSTPLFSGIVAKRENAIKNKPIMYRVTLRYCNLQVHGKTHLYIQNLMRIYVIGSSPIFTTNKKSNMSNKINIKILCQNIVNNPGDFTADELENWFNQYAEQKQNDTTEDDDDSMRCKTISCNFCKDNYCTEKGLYKDCIYITK